MAKKYIYAKTVDDMTFYTKSTATLGFSASASATVAKHGLTFTPATGSAEFYFTGLKASIGSPLVVGIESSNGITWNLKKMEVEATGIYAEKKAAKVDTGLAETEAAVSELEQTAMKTKNEASSMLISAVKLRSSAVSVS